MSLERAVVFQRLDWRWTWKGLGLLHLVIAGVPGMLVLFLGFVFGYNLLVGPAVSLATLAALALLQWRQDHNYIPDLLRLLITPTRLTHLDEDDVTPPFPVAREDLL